MQLNNNATITKDYQETINVNNFLNDDSEFRELIGVHNGFYYCTELDQCSEYNPREWSNLWYFIGINSIGFDYNARNMSDFDTHIYQKFGVDVDIEDIYQRNNNSNDFINDLKNVFKKHDLFIEPIEEYQHTLTRFSRGVGGGWDSGIGGFAIVSKSKIKEWYLHKIVTSKDKQNALEALENELNLFTDAYNGWVYDIVVYNKNLDMVDRLGEFYETDIDYMKDEKTLLSTMISELDTSSELYI